MDFEESAAIKPDADTLANNIGGVDQIIQDTGVHTGQCSAANKEIIALHKTAHFPNHEKNKSCYVKYLHLKITFCASTDLNCKEHSYWQVNQNA